jgi:prepilin-type N-terminal cleavage/methylation domain-containing protein
MRKEDLARKKEGGFTLIEIIIVAALLGMLGMIVMNRFSGTVQESMRGRVLVDTVKNVADSWNLLCTQMGHNVMNIGNGMGFINANNNALDVIVYGEDCVEDTAGTNYVSDYRNSGVKPLSDAFITRTAPVGGSSQGEYSVLHEDYNVTMSVDRTGGRRVCLLYENIPVDTAYTACLEMEPEATCETNLNFSTGGTPVDYEGRNIKWENYDAGNHVLELTICSFL